jgi:hypothetical protein
LFYTGVVTASLATLTIAHAHLPLGRASRTRPQVPPVRLEEDWAEAPAGFRLVLLRAKRDRLARRAQALGAHRACSVRGCAAESLPVLLVDSETEALLCPYHQLVHLDGTPVAGEPMLATGSW